MTQITKNTNRTFTKETNFVKAAQVTVHDSRSFMMIRDMKPIISKATKDNFVNNAM